MASSTSNRSGASASHIRSPLHLSWSTCAFGDKHGLAEALILRPLARFLEGIDAAAAGQPTLREHRGLLAQQLLGELGR